MVFEFQRELDDPVIAEAIGQLKECLKLLKEGRCLKEGLDLLLTVRRGFLGRIDIRAELRGPEIANPPNPS